MNVAKGDFIELNFIAKVKDTNQVFDLTKEGDAKAMGLYNPKMKYNPIVICVGEKNVVQGLDEELVGKELGKKYSVEVNSEKAFGKKDTKLLKMVPSNVFLKNNIRPMTGLQVNLDGLVGIIRSVSGGRVVVDFNHPLAGRDLVYDLEITKKITDVHDKIHALIKFYLPMKVEHEFKDNNLTIYTEMPQQFSLNLVQALKKAIPEIKEVLFIKKKVEEKPNPKNE